MNKTLLLSPKQYINGANTPRGIITIECTKDSLSGKLRTYNLNINTAEVVVGIYHNGKIAKTTLRSVERGAYSFSLVGDYEDLSDLYFAVVLGDKILLCGGVYNNSVTDIETLLFDDKNLDDDDYATESEKDVQEYFMQSENIDYLNKIESQTGNDTIAMPYVENMDMGGIVDEQIFPISSNSVDEQIEAKDEKASKLDKQLNAAPEQIDPIVSDEGESVDFFANISEQIDELLAKYPEDEQLGAIVPDAKFVKINSDESGEDYILGVIYQDSEIRYLAYGVPGSYDSEPPQVMKGKCQWLPVDITDPLSDGYYVIYQDTKTGQLVNIDIV